MFKNIKKFSQDLKNLLMSMKKYWLAILIATIFTTTASILTLMAPNKLANLTNELSKGLMPQEKVVKEIMTNITNNLNEKRLQEIALSLINVNQEKVLLALENKDLSPNDQNILKMVLQHDLRYFMKLSSSLKEKILEDQKYNGQLIKAADIIIFFDCLNNKNITDIPANILEIILPNLIIKNTIITTEDQRVLLKLYQNASGQDSNKMIKNIASLPKSVNDVIKPVLNLNKVKSITLKIALLYLVTTLFNYIEAIIIVIVAISYSKNLRKEIICKINKLPLKYLDNTMVGDILSRMTNDIHMISEVMDDSLSSLISVLTLLIGSVIMMFKTNKILAITAISASLIGFIFISLIAAKSQKYFINRQKELGKLNGHIEESFTNHNVITLYNGQKTSEEEFNKLNQAVYICEKKSQFLAGLMPPVMSFVGNFGYVAVCIIGAILTMKGYISFGVIVAFMIYIRLFTNPLRQIAQAIGSLQGGTAAGARVFEFLNQKELTTENNKKLWLDNQEVKGEITFDNVIFGYDKNKVIINNFKANIKPGEKIAIVGPTGAGKTTLVNLLMRFYEIDSGDIKIDGISIKDLTRENIHNLFTMVLQDTWLFNGTIRDNIKYNKTKISDQDIWRVCQTIGIDHFIKTLPKGLDSLITDTDSISSGQKQLLTIARGMIHNAPFLILDEATSNVDTRTEELVQMAMDKLMQNKTSFIIAHRLSTIKNADLILVLKEGSIIEQGSHKELMAKNGFYAKLYNSQFEKVAN